MINSSKRLLKGESFHESFSESLHDLEANFVKRISGQDQGPPDGPDETVNHWSPAKPKSFHFKTLILDGWKCNIIEMRMRIQTSFSTALRSTIENESSR